MEPASQTLAGSSASRIIKRYFLAVRPMFLTASILPVLVGSSWGAMQTGSLRSLLMILASLAIALVHAAVNVLNDVYDDANGTDQQNRSRIFPFTGGSRFIQNGVLSRTQMKQYARLLLAAALIAGIVLTLLEGPVIILLGVLGIGLGVLYSMPPVALASRGLGELAVALGFGMLPVIGAYWLQAGQIEPVAWVVAIPVSCWVANILIMNEIPDAEADAMAGKSTLVVRLGIRATRWLYAGVSLLALLAVIMLLRMSPVTLWGVIPMILLALVSFLAVIQIQTGSSAISLKSAIQKTLMVHALGCVWLLLWPWL